MMYAFLNNFQKDFSEISGTGFVMQTCMLTIILVTVAIVCVKGVDKMKQLIGEDNQTNA